MKGLKILGIFLIIFTVIFGALIAISYIDSSYVLSVYQDITSNYEVNGEEVIFVVKITAIVLTAITLIGAILCFIFASKFSEQTEEIEEIKKVNAPKKEKEKQTKAKVKRFAKKTAKKIGEDVGKAQISNITHGTTNGDLASYLDKFKK